MNEQINISIPTHWKTKLINLAVDKSKKEHIQISYLDLIRDSIKNTYSLMEKDSLINAQMEIALCSDNFKYFASKYLFVRCPKNGISKLNTYSHQDRLIEQIQNSRFIIGSKFRQGGFTTILAAYALWRCLFRFNQRIGFCSKTDRESAAIGEHIDFMLDNLPEYFTANSLGRFTTHTKHFCKTDSRITFRGSQAGCGESFTHLFIDEFDFFSDQENTWETLLTTIQNEGRLVMVSTLNGTGAFKFKTLLKEAKEAKNNFALFECHYSEVPEFDADWSSKMQKQMGNGFYTEILQGRKS